MGDLANLPPTDGPVVAAPAPAVNIANQDPGVPMEIIAEHPDLSAIAAAAVANGHQWEQGIAPLLDSAQGFGSAGFSISGGNAAGADGNWPTNVDFPHQGP
jgi:hypothetical protein